MKRFFDFTMSLLLIILLSPLFLIISVIILFDAGSPVIFKQYRVGKDNKLFYVYKFRTMHCNTRNVATDELTESVNCITKSGRFLRKTSLDELPQLFNVLKGEMSIVGPRPALPREVAQYTAYEWQRLYVTPGLSCYWQIAPHRNQLSFEEWMALDVKYVKERSFLVDWKIIFRTFRSMLFGHGE